MLLINHIYIYIHKILFFIFLLCLNKSIFSLDCNSKVSDLATPNNLMFKGHSLNIKMAPVLLPPTVGSPETSIPLKCFQVASLSPGSDHDAACLSFGYSPLACNVPVLLLHSFK